MRIDEFDKYDYQEYPANDNYIFVGCLNVNHHHSVGDKFIREMTAMPDCKVAIGGLMLTNCLTQFLVNLQQEPIDASNQATLLMGASSRRVERLVSALGNPETDVVTMPVAETKKDRKEMRLVFAEAESAVKAVLEPRASRGSVLQARLSYIDHRDYIAGLPGKRLRLRRLLFPVALGGHVLMVGMEAEGETLANARRAYLQRGGRAC
jgi:hypothetical protein